MLREEGLGRDDLALERIAAVFERLGSGRAREKLISSIKAKDFSGDDGDDAITWMEDVLHLADCERLTEEESK